MQQVSVYLQAFSC